MFKLAKCARIYPTRNLYLCSCTTNRSVERDKNRNSFVQFQRHNFSSQSSIEPIVRPESGIFKMLSESAPVEFAQNLVVNFHDMSGLPWWATIVCTTVLLRTAVTAPLAVYQHYILGKVANLRGELEGIAKELKVETDVAVKLLKWDNRTANLRYKYSLKQQWNALVVRDNCHPAKAWILLWFQIPMWVSVSVALRNLTYMLPHTDGNAYATFVELSTEGFGWFSNLTQPDPLIILPIAMGLVNLTIVEIQALSKIEEPSKLQRYVLNFFRGFCIIIIPIAAYVPSCITMYWFTSSCYGLIQNIILLSPKVRRVCRIPYTQIELEKPYTQIFVKAKSKINLLTNKII